MKKTRKIIISILLLILTVFTVFVTPITVSASFEPTDITKTSVIEDLGKMGLDSIQNLSSTENLFLGMSQYYDSSRKLHTYVYMNYIGSPDDILKAKISTSVSNSVGYIVEDFKDYKLNPVDTYRTWVKYEVLDLPNITKSTRRYKFKSISSRDYTLEVDDMYAFNGITNVQMEVFRQEIDTITITDSEIEFFCYGKDSNWADWWGFPEYMASGNTYSDAWYIFFNTDKPMDDILEIEITYLPYNYTFASTSRYRTDHAFTENYLKRCLNGDCDHAYKNKHEDWGTSINYLEQETVTIKPGTTKVESSKDKWYSKYDTDYEEYIDNIIDLSKQASTGDSIFVFSEEKQKYRWGVNFAVTSKTFEEDGIPSILVGAAGRRYTVDGVGVVNTAILRIKYEHNGLVKNAYAVDEIKNSFSGESAIIPEKWDWKTIVKILIAIILVLLLWPIISPILKLCFEALVTVIKVAFKLVLLPLTWLLNLRHKKKSSSENDIKKE